MVRGNGEVRERLFESGCLRVYSLFTLFTGVIAFSVLLVRNEGDA